MLSLFRSKTAMGENETKLLLQLRIETEPKFHGMKSHMTVWNASAQDVRKTGCWGKNIKTEDLGKNKKGENHFLLFHFPHPLFFPSSPLPASPQP